MGEEVSCVQHLLVLASELKLMLMDSKNHYYIIKGAFTSCALTPSSYDIDYWSSFFVWSCAWIKMRHMYCKFNVPCLLHVFWCKCCITTHINTNSHIIVWCFWRCKFFDKTCFPILRFNVIRDVTTSIVNLNKQRLQVKMQTIMTLTKGCHEKSISPYMLLGSRTITTQI